MLSVFDYLRELNMASVVVRLLLAMLVGGLIGMERERKRRAAGFRTYMLVCIGAALTMLLGQYQSVMLELSGTAAAGDVSRYGAQVINGIGFLGAGTIVVTRHSHIRGLTTAAGLWASAGVGLALGIGFYEGAFIAGFAIFVTMTLLQHLDSRVHRNTKTMEVYVELGPELPLGTFLRLVRDLGMETTDIQYDSDIVLEKGHRAFLAILRSPKRRDHTLMAEEVRQIEGVLVLEEL